MHNGFEFPDSLPSNESAVATYIPFRSPEFKVHRTEGLANSAMGQRSINECFAKYHMKDGQWVKVFEHYPAKECAWCRAKLEHPRDRRTPPGVKSPKWKQPTICTDCWATAEGQRRREQQEERDRAELRRLQEKYK